MKIIYMGTPEFAVPGLRKLVENCYQVVGVVTSPDKPQGRGLKVGMSPVKAYALEAGIPVLQPEKLKDETFLSDLKSLQADVQIVVAFRMLPQVVWDMPPQGTFNLHASLLPQYRGAAPINWAIINGETTTGVTTFFLQHEIDTGDLILQVPEDITPDDTAGSLYERLMHKGADAILTTVQMIEKGVAKGIPQSTAHQLRAAPKIFKNDCRINWNLPAVDIRNFIRGLSPHPGAYMHLNGNYFKVLEVSIVNYDKQNHEATSFETDQKTYLHISCAIGTIAISVLQPEGKKKMSIKEYLIGHKIEKVE